MKQQGKVILITKERPDYTWGNEAEGGREGGDDDDEFEALDKIFAFLVFVAAAVASGADAGDEESSGG